MACRCSLVEHRWLLYVVTLSVSSPRSEALVICCVLGRRTATFAAAVALSVATILQYCFAIAGHTVLHSIFPAHSIVHRARPRPPPFLAWQLRANPSRKVQEETLAGMPCSGGLFDRKE